MAKKEKAPKAEAADKPEAAATEGEAAPKKSLIGKLLSKKMLMFGLPAILVLLLGGGGVYYFLLRAPAPDKTTADGKDPNAPIVPPQVAFSDIDPITVNLQTQEATPAYLRITASLELDSPEAKTGIQALLPRISDQFQAYLRELRVDDLKGSEGVLRIKEELLRRANVAAAPYKVRDVLLKEMVVQ